MPKRAPHPSPGLLALRKPLLTTKEAADALSFAESTLRHWSTSGKGPIQPYPIEGSTALRWRLNDIRRLCGYPPLADGPDPSEAQQQAALDEQAAATRASLEAMLGDMDRMRASARKLIDKLGRSIVAA